MDGGTDGVSVGCVTDDGDTSGRQGVAVTQNSFDNPRTDAPAPTPTTTAAATAAAAAAATLRSQTSTLPAKNKDQLFPFFFFFLSSIFQRFSG